MLDTQAFLWSISAPKRQGARRLTLAEDPQRFVPDQMAQNAFEPLSMQIRHALKVVDLPNVHRDPFDRLLAPKPSSKSSRSRAETSKLPAIRSELSGSSPHID